MGKIECLVESKPLVCTKGGCGFYSPLHLTKGVCGYIYPWREVSQGVDCQQGLVDGGNEYSLFLKKIRENARLNLNQFI